MKRSGLRKTIQSLWAIICNAYVKGFISGTIYTGALKHFCVPGLNCYSCPGALFACPIGSLQSFLSARNRKVPVYIIGFLSFIGLLVGRFVCGWLCLFGLIQELLYMIPVKKISIPEKADKILRYLKYVILVLFVILLPLVIRGEGGVGDPYFCKYICPAGTLEGGVFLVLLNSSVRSAVGALFKWKFAILSVVVLSAVFIHRPFCKYICPLGAIYGLFQRISFLRLAFDGHKCTSCGKCSAACKMQVDPRNDPDSAECIRCGECINNCPENALSFKVCSRVKENYKNTSDIN